MTKPPSGAPIQAAASPPRTVVARAKVNLTLDVLGRLPNGYHALRSLVVFAGVGDRLRVDETAAGAPYTRAVSATTGPFAGALDGANLVDRARDVLAQAHPGLRFPTVTLEKNLPVAAGIGGGSADAAAYLRLVQAWNPEEAWTVDWHAIGLRLGADVPACLASRPVVMTGVGDRLVPVTLPRRLPAVLVNPRCPVPTTKTADVFRTLAAGPIDAAEAADGPTPAADELERMILTGRNDLSAAAATIMPDIGVVLARLADLPGALVSRLSGAGPTAFALFERSAHARAAARHLSERQPEWWVRATLLG